MTNAASSSETSSDFSTKIAHLRHIVEDICSCAQSGCTTQELGCKAKEAACKAKDMAVDASRKVVDTVRKYPVESTAVAVGAGLLVWWLLSRRNASQSV